jgi:hypothetical protein
MLVGAGGHAVRTFVLVPFAFEGGHEPLAPDIAAADPGGAHLLRQGLVGLNLGGSELETAEGAMGRGGRKLLVLLLLVVGGHEVSDDALDARLAEGVGAARQAARLIEMLQTDGADPGVAAGLFLADFRAGPRGRRGAGGGEGSGSF